MVNDSKAILAGNEADPFSGIQEWKMTGIPGHLGNGSPGMETLLMT